MGNPRGGLWLAWLATFWLIGVLVMSMLSYVRGVDVVALAIALTAQVGVVIAWSLYRPLPLWIVAGHGLIMLSLVLGFVVTAPASPPPDPAPAIALPWMLVGLVPAGLAMIAAALVAWNREHVVGA
jgi:hypothetical protein